MDKLSPSCCPSIMNTLVVLSIYMYWKEAQIFWGRFWGPFSTAFSSSPYKCIHYSKMLFHNSVYASEAMYSCPSEIISLGTFVLFYVRKQFLCKRYITYKWTTFLLYPPDTFVNTVLTFEEKQLKLRMIGLGITFITLGALSTFQSSKVKFSSLLFLGSQKTTWSKINQHHLFCFAF